MVCRALERVERTKPFAVAIKAARPKKKTFMSEIKSIKTTSL